MLLGPASSNVVFNSERLVGFIVLIQKWYRSHSQKKNVHQSLVVSGVAKLRISYDSHISWESHYSHKRHC